MCELGEKLRSNLTCERRSKASVSLMRLTFNYEELKCSRLVPVETHEMKRELRLDVI